MPTAAIDFAPAIAGFTNAFIREREARDLRQAKTGQVLFEAAKADPSLFDDPTASKAMEKYIGDKDAFGLVKNIYQNQPTAEQIAYGQAKGLGVVTPEEQQAVMQAENQAQGVRAANAQTPSENPIAAIARGAMGAVPFVGKPAANALFGPAPQAPNLPVPNPYAGAREVLGERGPTVPGATVTTTAKGGTSVSRTGPTRKEADEMIINHAVATRVGEIRQERPGTSRDNALIQAARETFEASTAQHMIPPDWVRSLATGTAENEIRLGLEAGKKQLDLAYAGPIASGTEVGRRLGAQQVPQTPEEAAARATREARVPVEGQLEGRPLTAEEQAARLQGYREQFAQGKSLAAGRGTSQAGLEREARKSANDLFSLNDTLTTFAPMAATILTASPLQAKTGIQKLKLYMKSGTGDPGIAGLSNLESLIPRITRLVGGDVGNLAIQEQAAYRNIVGGRWQTSQEFVTNMLTLSMGMDRMAAAKADVLGLPPPPAGKMRQELEPYRKRYPAIDAAIKRFDEATRAFTPEAQRAKIAESLQRQGLTVPTAGAAPASPEGPPPTLDLGDGFTLVPVQ